MVAGRDRPARQAAKPSEVVGSKSVGKSGGLSAVTGVANVEIMKMADRTRVNEILWRVDARMRPALEQQKGTQFWKINDTILSETSRILLQQHEVGNALKSKLSLNDEPLRRLTWQSLFHEATHAKSPADYEIDRMHGVAQKLPVSKQEDRLLTDKVLAIAVEKSLAGHEVTVQEMQKEVATMTKFLANQSDREQLIEKNRSQHKDLGKGVAPDVKI